MARNGHCTYLPGCEWILNDSYPDDNRLQSVYLYHVATGDTGAAGEFLHAHEIPFRLGGPCGHPSEVQARTAVLWSSTRRTRGMGGRMYLLDISSIIDGKPLK